MVSTVETRPNHYEILGIEPGASSAEIERAFARELLRPRVFGGIALVGIAYETLKDPAKRRDYDRSIGLIAEPAAEPETQSQPPQWGFAVAQVGWAPLVASATRKPAEPHVMPRPEPEPEAAAEEEPIDQRLAAIAASLRELAKPAAPAREERPRAEAETKLPLESLLANDPPPRRRVELRFGEDEERPVQWSRTGLTVGGLVLGVAVLGAAAGWSAGLVEPQQPQPQARTRIALPPAKPVAAADAAPAAPEWIAEEPSRWAGAPWPRRSAAVREPVQQIASGQPAESAPADPLELPAVAQDGEPAQALAASMPLPNSVVARTIGRIGYACGEVASTAPVDGARGVFRVTCTSGHSYQATPVRGRYHFRRIGGR